MEFSEGAAPKPKPPAGISRRNLLKAGLAIGLSQMARSSVSKPAELLIKATQAPKPPATPTPEQKEDLRPIQDNVIMVDFAPETPDEKIKQAEYPDNIALIKSFLGDKFISPEQLRQEFGLSSLSLQTLDNHNKLRQVPDKYPEAGLIYGFIYTFQHHASQVAETMDQVWKMAGVQSKPNIIPAQSFIDKNQISFRKDQLGNPALFFQVNTGAVINSLRKARQSDPNLKVINLSLQFGEMGLAFTKKEKKVAETLPQFVKDIDTDGHELGWFLNTTGKWAVRIDKLKDGSRVFITEDGENIPVTTSLMTRKEYLKRQKIAIEENTEIVESEYPDFDIIGAYNRDKVEQNIQGLFKVCEAFPELTVVAASGNWHDDLRPVKERPANLIIAGVWYGRGEDFNTNGIEGADIYVPNTRESSFATAAISSIASVLASKGLDTAQIKSTLMGLTNESNYDVYDPETDEFVSQTAHVLDTYKALQYLKK